MRHKKRYDFKHLLVDYGVSSSEYRRAIIEYDYSVFDDAIVKIAKDACEHIKRRNLDLPPVHIRRKEDTTTGKIRDIGKESAMQQVYDHIAVHSCDEIFRCRMVDQQMSSLPKRGQIKGMQLIRKWITDDNRAIRYAEKHGKRYASKCKYFTKLDIVKCYPSADLEVFMDILEHDCGNEDIIWLWRTLLESHHVEGYKGFMIGALPSQWACQVMLSYIYRRAMELKYTKRGKTYKKVSHMIMFMDDMTLFGSNRRQLLSAVTELTEYTRDNLHLEIKPTFAIHELENTGVDMMGFVVYRNGKVEMRGRNFIRSRRIVLRYRRTGRLVFPQAQRLNAYKGFYKWSDSRKISRDLEIDKVFKYCSKIISKHDKEKHDAQSLFHGRARPDFISAPEQRNGGGMAANEH